MNSRLFERTLFIALLAVAGALAAVPAAQQPGVDPAQAAQHLREARSLCEKDAGKLWGISLCGPLLFVDPKTRAAVASQADREGKLRQEGELFAGNVPAEINLGNTALEWAGVKWTMLLWPLPAEVTARRTLVAHELFHRVQEELGLPSPFVVCLHLDTKEGRIWLQLEWRALRTALLESGEARRRAMQDALIFRAHRHQLFSKGAADERSLELNEGLAEYTGLKLGGTPAPAMEFLAKRLQEAQERPSFVRQFAYESGPAYAFLLDATGGPWRKGLKAGDDLGTLLGKALGFAPPEALGEEAEKRLENYGGRALREVEASREMEREKLTAEYRKKLVDGAVLILALSGKMGFGFDPYAVISLGEAGTVYRTLRVTADWGILEATAGALLVRDGERPLRVVVAAPAEPMARPVRGPGWTLELAPGWTLGPGERKGDFVLRKSE